MSIFTRIKSFSFDRNRMQQFGLKSAIVWGHSAETNSISPLLYISKPRGVTQEQYDELIDAIEIKFVIKPKP